MSTQTTFIEPLDVLFLRGNKLFGDPGSHGESLIPPWPRPSPRASYRIPNWAPRGSRAASPSPPFIWLGALPMAG